jgi:hypothetical protein
MEYINLGEREVLARYRANGQMSYIPGIWDPVWSRGQVLAALWFSVCFTGACRLAHMCVFSMLLGHVRQHQSVSIQTVP